MFHLKTDEMNILLLDSVILAFLPHETIRLEIEQ